MLRHILPAVALAALAASPAAAQTRQAQTGQAQTRQAQTGHAQPAPGQPQPAPGVSLMIRDGKVTLKAEQASLRQILAEWERQGQVRVVGADKLVGAPLTLTLVEIPEKQALDIVMRGDMPDALRRDRDAWTACVAGALDEREYVDLLTAAGFEHAAVEPTRVFDRDAARVFLSSDMADRAGAAEAIGGRLISAFVRAVKPAAACCGTTCCA
jgi:hypothetical protein